MPRQFRGVWFRALLSPVPRFTPQVTLVLDLWDRHLPKAVRTLRTSRLIGKLLTDLAVETRAMLCPWRLVTMTVLLSWPWVTWESPQMTIMLTLCVA